MRENTGSGQTSGSVRVYPFFPSASSVSFALRIAGYIVHITYIYMCVCVEVSEKGIPMSVIHDWMICGTPMFLETSKICLPVYKPIIQHSLASSISPP